MKNLISYISGRDHIIWDWNGTLIDDVQHAVTIMNQILVEHRLPQIDSHTYREIFEFPVVNYYRKLGFDFTRHEFSELSHRFVDLYMSKLNECNLFPHSKYILNFIRTQGQTQSLLSATDQDNLQRAIQHYELDEYFDFLTGLTSKLADSKVEQGKRLMEAAQIPAAKTVLIGDTAHDLEVGQALGVDVILLAHGHQSEHRLKKIHDKVLVLRPLANLSIDPTIES